MKSELQLFHYEHIRKTILIYLFLFVYAYDNLLLQRQLLLLQNYNW